MTAHTGRKASTGMAQMGMRLRSSEAWTYAGTGSGSLTTSGTGAAAAAAGAALDAASTSVDADAAGAAAPPASPPPSPSAARRSWERFSRCSGTSVNASSEAVVDRRGGERTGPSPDGATLASAVRGVTIGPTPPPDLAERGEPAATGHGAGLEVRSRVGATALGPD